MQTKELSNGPFIPMLGIGTWRISGEEGKDIENIGRLLSVDDGIDLELALRLDHNGIKSQDMRRLYEEVDYDLEKALKLVTA